MTDWDAVHYRAFVRDEAEYQAGLERREQDEEEWHRLWSEEQPDLDLTEPWRAADGPTPHAHQKETP